MRAEWDRLRREGLRQIRKCTQVDTPPPDDFYANEVRAAVHTAHVVRLNLSPHRHQIGPGLFENAHTTMCVVLGGAMILATDSGPERVSRGDVYLPHHASHHWTDVTTPAHLVVVSPRRVATEPQATSGTGDLGRWRMPESSLSLFESLCDWMCSTTDDAQTESVDAAGAMLLTLLSRPGRDSDDEFAHDLRGSSPDVVYEEAIRVVDAEFRDPDLNAPSLAKRLGVSLRTLHRAFESRAMSVSKEIRRRRTTHAENLLRNPSYSHMAVSEIARVSGAPSIAYLRTAIKEKYNVSPSQLRGLRTAGAGNFQP